ncbi:MAG: HlyD family secretion protein [Bacteroidales bacterium]|nr:HlyD family secretion protein [Bacteroidales bacterium]
MEKNKNIVRVLNVVVICLLVGGLVFVCSRFMHFGNVEYTDNAQVHRNIVPIQTRIPGFIKEVRFDDYQHVHKGDTLVIIEDAEFRLGLAQARAGLATATAGSSATGAGITTTSANMHITSAGIEEARVQLENAKREEERFAALLKQEAVTRQQYDGVHTAYLSAKARYEAVSRQKEMLTHVKNEQGHRLTQSQAGIEAAEAAVRMAELNLSYTVIVATCDGVTGRKDIHVGQLVNPGQTLVNIDDECSLWVTANYRESQLSNIHEGSQVEIRVDAVPGVTFRGEVERISTATGTAFSAIPQDNATGNFVKIEQRVPVRIVLKGNEEADMKQLRNGLNVECEVVY